MMETKKIFNPAGNDSRQNRRIVGGNSTNLFNLNDVKYSWAKPMYRMMMGNFWVPEKVDLSADILDYGKLSDVEREALKNILSFLVFLDSIQTTNIPNIADYITAPEVNTLLTIQAYQEAVHSQSYAYIIETVIPPEERSEIYEEWRSDPQTLERNKYLAGIYQDFQDDPSDYNFQRVVIANLILEGLYFYNGFAFFYNLASRNLCLGIADEIRYINRDELTHLTIFAHMIREMKKENPGWFSEEMVSEMLLHACDQEISWSLHVLSPQIVGISAESIENYTRFLANRILTLLDMEPLFSKTYAWNPYEHLTRFADEDNDGVKGNFFEATVTNYNQSSSMSGWDDF